MWIQNANSIPMPAIAQLDTGCPDGNWISPNMILELGLGTKVSTVDPPLILKDFGNHPVEARYSIWLDWSWQERGAKARLNFFYVRPQNPPEHANYDILFGAPYINAHGLLTTNEGSFNSLTPGGPPTTGKSFQILSSTRIADNDIIAERIALAEINEANRRQRAEIRRRIDSDRSQRNQYDERGQSQTSTQNRGNGHPEHGYEPQYDLRNYPSTRPQNTPQGHPSYGYAPRDYERSEQQRGLAGSSRSPPQFGGQGSSLGNPQYIQTTRSTDPRHFARQDYPPDLPQHAQPSSSRNERPRNQQHYPQDPPHHSHRSQR